jgi:hypothetical protein
LRGQNARIGVENGFQKDARVSTAHAVGSETHPDEPEGRTGTFRRGRQGLTAEGGEAMVGYCVKCREKRDMVSTTEVTMKNGKNAIKGKCGTCGTGIFKILPAKKK